MFDILMNPDKSNTCSNSFEAADATLATEVLYMAGIDITRQELRIGETCVQFRDIWRISEGELSR